MGILVDTMRTEELLTVSAILGKIYLTNPLNTATFGKNLRSNEALFRLCLEFTPGIHRYVAKENGQIVGVMGMTEWPNCQYNGIKNYLTLRSGTNFLYPLIQDVGSLSNLCTYAIICVRGLGYKYPQGTE